MGQAQTKEQEHFRYLNATDLTLSIESFIASVAVIGLSVALAPETAGATLIGIPGQVSNLIGSVNRASEAVSEMKKGNVSTKFNFDRVITNFFTPSLAFLPGGGAITTAVAKGGQKLFDELIFNEGDTTHPLDRMANTAEHTARMASEVTKTLPQSDLNSFGSPLATMQRLGRSGHSTRNIFRTAKAVATLNQLGVAGYGSPQKRTVANLGREGE